MDKKTKEGEFSVKVLWRICKSPLTKSTIASKIAYRIDEDKILKKARQTQSRGGIKKEDNIMKEFKYTLTDPEGIHARPAGELVKKAKEFESAITITKDGKSADAKRIFALMGLAAKQGQEVVVSAEGADEDAAIEAMSEFMKANL